MEIIGYLVFLATIAFVVTVVVHPYRKARKQAKEQAKVEADNAALASWYASRKTAAHWYALGMTPKQVRGQLHPGTYDEDGNVR